jgi:hypothetical protein
MPFLDRKTVTKKLEAELASLHAREAALRSRAGPG